MFERGARVTPREIPAAEFRVSARVARARFDYGGQGRARLRVARLRAGEIEPAAVSLLKPRPIVAAEWLDARVLSRDKLADGRRSQGRVEISFAPRVELAQRETHLGVARQFPRRRKSRARDGLVREFTLAPC